MPSITSRIDNPHDLDRTREQPELPGGRTDEALDALEDEIRAEREEQDRRIEETFARRDGEAAKPEGEVIPLPTRQADAPPDDPEAT